MSSPDPRPFAEPIPTDAPALPPIPTVPARPAPSTALIVFTVLGFTVVGFLALAVTAYLFFGLGPVAFVICGILALLPLAVVITAITLIDRWEPEPRPALLFAFLWGAAASVAAALVVDVGVQIFLEIAAGGAESSDVLASVLQAPLVEEGAKGLGVLLIFWVFRRQFDGPVDGLVYGATIAAGFAFTENILYFASALPEGVASLGITFGLRGIMSPFAHVMFTACTGVAIGFAARSRNVGVGILIVLAGWALAVGLHAFWNGSTYLVQGLGGFFLLYVLVQVPLFAVAIILVVLLRRAETRATAARLREYAAAGWYTADEVLFLSTGAGRRAALRWAGGLPGNGRRAMKAFIRDSTRLAFTRQRIVSGRGGLAPLADERTLLDAVTADRIALATARGLAL